MHESEGRKNMKTKASLCHVEFKRDPHPNFNLLLCHVVRRGQKALESTPCLFLGQVSGSDPESQERRYHPQPQGKAVCQGCACLRAVHHPAVQGLRRPEDVDHWLTRPESTLLNNRIQLGGEKTMTARETVASHRKHDWCNICWHENYLCFIARKDPV